MIPDLNNKSEIERIIREVDSTARLWDCTPPWVRYHRREFDFECDDFKISIIDPFNGRIPTVISRETLAGGLPPLIPTVLLDSNVMASLHQYVTNPDRLDEKQKKVIINLLDYLIHEKADYNPVFYYLESFSKTGVDNPKIIDYSKSLLRLHMMDELRFLTRREIVPDVEQLKNYTNKFGTNDVDEMARHQYDYLRSRFEPNNDWKIMYLIILKAALIQKTSRSNLTAKTQILYEFIYSIFGVLFSEELFIATHYFSGKLDKFIPLQKGANFDSALMKLKATAWDLYLLRLPALFLSYEDPPFPLAVICTGDRSLQHIGRKIRIRKLYTIQGAPFPELEMDYSDLSGSSKEESPILKLFNEFQKNRQAKRRSLDTESVLNRIDDVILDLEAHIREFCRTGT